MRKNKISAINSYASYKQNKKKISLSFVILLIGGMILISALFSGRIQADMNTFFFENGLNVSGTKDSKPSQDIIIAEGRACYDLYTTPKVTKGIYVPSKKLVNIKGYIKLARKTQVNSFVIDVKDDNGYLTFATDNEQLNQNGIVMKKPPITDIDAVIDQLDEAGIYPIARIVVFKDNVYTEGHPKKAVKAIDGSTYVTKSGDKWLDPYDQDNWNYILDVCREAERRGFKEIQFDYVRFHESMSAKKVILQGGKSKTAVITEFTRYMCEQLHQMGLKVSADVFGTVILSDIDADIVGQDFVEMSRYLDYISPMVYPSHYAEGTFGIEYPHLQAYDIVQKTLKVGQEKMAETGEKMAQMRPWLQDFTMSSKEPYLKYGPEQIKEQIQGSNDAGAYEWLFWNAAGNYTEKGLMDP